MSEAHIDYTARTERYKQMRADGELSHLTDAEYRLKLEAIGILWHGPIPERTLTEMQT